MSVIILVFIRCLIESNLNTGNDTLAWIIDHLITAILSIIGTLIALKQITKDRPTLHNVSVETSLTYINLVITITNNRQSYISIKEIYMREIYFNFIPIFKKQVFWFNHDMIAEDDSLLIKGSRKILLTPDKKRRWSSQIIVKTTAGSCSKIFNWKDYDLLSNPFF